MTILRDTLYSDKILAVLREYAANAWDANRMAGKADVPIEISLPTVTDPILRISDSGPGISENDVFNVFAKYGSSTKRNDDVAVGMLGIGSKSGFAYADTFNIISKNGGKRKVYVATLDESDKGLISLLHEEDCGDETGLTIEVAIDTGDIEEVTDKAKMLFTFFDPVPKINTTLPTWASDKLKNSETGTLFDGDGSRFTGSRMWIDGEDGSLRFGKGSWFAQMGCIVYPIDLEQITGEYKDRIPSYISNLAGIVKFEIGELSISASREDLRYTEATKKALATKLDDMISQFVLQILTDAANGATSAWDKKVRCKILAQMQLPVPKEWETFVREYVQLFTESSEPKTFNVSVRRREGSGHKDGVSAVNLSESNRFVLRDDRRSMKGYPLSKWDYIIEKVNKVDKTTLKTTMVSWEEVKEELDELLLDVGLEGIPIIKITDLPWTKPVVPRSAINVKHQKNFFELVRGSSQVTSSEAWNVSEDVPGPDDPVVILNRFEPDVDAHEMSIILRTIQTMVRDHPELKIETPRVFAIKSTEKKPVKVEDIKDGKYWNVWAKDFMAKIVKHPELENVFLKKAWEYTNIGGWEHLHRKEFIKKLKTELGPSNVIVKYFKRWSEVRAIKTKIEFENGYYFDQFRSIVRQHGFITFDAKERKDEVYNRYPLLKQSGGLHSVISEEQDAWIEYFKLKEEQYGKVAVVHDDKRVDHGGVEGKTNDREEGGTELRAPEESGSGGGVGVAGRRPDGEEVDRSVGKGGLLSEGQHVLPEEGGTPSRAERANPSDGVGERGSDASPELLAAAQAESLVPVGEPTLVVS